MVSQITSNACRIQLNSHEFTEFSDFSLPDVPLVYRIYSTTTERQEL